jgi:hypothetical protein
MEESLEDIRMLTSQYRTLTEDNQYADESDQTVLIKGRQPDTHRFFFSTHK